VNIVVDLAVAKSGHAHSSFDTPINRNYKYCFSVKLFWKHNMPSRSEKRLEQAGHLRSLVPLEIDPHQNIGGVLLSDEIIFYADNHNLIAPFSSGNLKPAGYELTVGDEYFLNGQFLELALQDPDKQTITIPPFEVAVLKTTEILCLPRFMIARWNIRVRHAYSGLLWVGGPQVDPGYVGHLFCPIYNLSDKAVTLHLGDPIALIDFVKTTPFDRNKPKSELKRYPFPKRLFLEDFEINDLRSALFTAAGQKLVEVQDQMKGLETRFITFTQISFAVFALVIALVALISKANAESISLSASFFGSTTIAVSVAAILIAIFSYVRGRMARLVYEQYGQLMGERAKDAERFLRRSWLIGLIVSMSIAIGAGIELYNLADPAFRSLRLQHVITKSDLESVTKSLSMEIDQLSNRIEGVERKRAATVEDLEKLKTSLEKEIEAARSGRQ
jgi:deoxycytidine triphosphate deaminase